ncbi:hypothetical protein BHAMNSH16_05055 [Brachyspira hampsonii]|uniref:Uncharacterized protein n=1 Tax=Brachyspira hampsonii TaxID=1287055 RepID=A0AAC9XJV9_9SPIR|nr:hypothetical protein [Brachyspira hampsonii]ASJ21045.1 hypothetical protein BHAMNSH16_05055 [Brachyspira hampsonii]MBW5380040.1 hypothetical protein [Brachyspira hampsonii]OEJ16867.1 hypothetical protein A9496_00885 [Brachyspira hampsonii]
MTAEIKENNNLFDLYKNYFNQTDLTLNNFTKLKKNELLSSLIKEVEEINSNRGSISEKDFESIYYILIKLSIIARIDLIIVMNSIKNKDMSFRNSLKYSKDVIDLSLRIIVKLLNKMNSEDLNLYFKEYLVNNDDIISHTNRVFITVVRFIKYYNDSIHNNIVIDIRKKFNKKYAYYYRSIFKKFNINKNVSKLEHVYKYGLRDMLFNEIINISIAAFWHDIVNVFNNYNTEHNADKCYSYLKHFIRYNDDISLTVALHNEYYGYGSGVFLNYYNTLINSNGAYNLDYAVSFDYNDTLKFSSVSYFPSKVLEIIDLFDRVNSSSSIDNTLLFIRENYLEVEVKIDPIIFDIFSSFVSDNMKLIA